MWSLDYVQVPKSEKTVGSNDFSSTSLKNLNARKQLEKGKSKERETKETEEKGKVAESESSTEKAKKRIQTLVQQMSISTEIIKTEEGLIAKSSSESSLSEDDKDIKKKKKESEKEEKERCSGKEDEDENDNLNTNCNQDFMITTKNLSINSSNSQIEKSFENKDKLKSEEVEGESLLEESEYNSWRRPSCKGDLHRQEAVQDGGKINVKLGKYSVITFKSVNNVLPCLL